MTVRYMEIVSDDADALAATAVPHVRAHRRSSNCQVDQPIWLVNDGIKREAAGARTTSA